ncbi:MAG: LTA synthase family protein [Eubacteriales bacterium]|nr:LTA synthase family protein [Eubacteriales bacterium]
MKNVDAKASAASKRRSEISYSAAYTAAFFVLFVIYEEMLLHSALISRFDVKSVFMLLFCFPLGIAIYLASSIMPKKLADALGMLLLLFFAVLFGSQFIYHKIFGGFFSVSQISMGGTAIANFFKETAYTVYENLGWIALIFLPCIVFAVLDHFGIFNMNGDAHGSRVILLCLAVIITLASVVALHIDGTGYFTPYDYYYSSQTGTDESVEYFGVLTTMRLELTHMLLHVDEDEIDYNTVAVIQNIRDAVDFSPNEIEAIDFAALNKKTASSRIGYLNSYFMNKAPTIKNQYTGIFEGYNLIMLCAESFSPYLIDKDRTPTLYKLSNEGIIFSNYYNSYPNTTTNGEYSLQMGLFPDLSRNKYDASFVYAADNYLPFCLGNMFRAAGANTYAFHNYIGSYFNRSITHPALGYTCKFMDDGMTFTTEWPTSDLEMMEQSVGDYINDDWFHAYYMTFSGHYKYNFAINPMSARNKDLVRDLDYSEPVKAYIACNMELEKALEYLIEQLKQAGKYENTVIVLAGDHYPYGLTEQEYNELAGTKIDPAIGKFKSTLICWCGGLENNIYCDEYCCTIDVLPTLLNLFGMEYDSRLIVGVDAFSNSDHTAILANQSFINQYVRFDAGTNKAIWLVDESKVPGGYNRYLSNMINSIKTKMTVCTYIVDKDYYRFVYDNTDFSAAQNETPEEASDDAPGDEGQ